MASITIKNLNLSYPLLGAGVRIRLKSSEMDSAGAVIKDDTRKTRSVQALHNISLSLKDGDRLGLVGRNGSGKSTLLRVIAGIYEPLEGTVDVQGSVSSLFNVGLGVNPESTGYRNIELMGLIAGYSKKQIQEMTPAIAEFSGLGGYLSLPVRTYSNGMAMRLKFSAATAFSPDILLMDEWLGAGDPEFKEKARARMRELVSKAGILILASHNLGLIRKECTQVLWLHRGVIRAHGPTDRVLREMANSDELPLHMKQKLKKQWRRERQERKQQNQKIN